MGGKAGDMSTETAASLSVKWIKWMAASEKPAKCQVLADEKKIKGKEFNQGGVSKKDWCGSSCVTCGRSCVIPRCSVLFDKPPPKGWQRLKGCICWGSCVDNKCSYSNAKAVMADGFDLVSSPSMKAGDSCFGTKRHLCVAVK